MTDFSAILIDFDDTLVNTEPLKRAALKQFLAENGVTQFEREAGQSSARIISDIFTEDSDKLIEVFNVFQADYVGQHVKKEDVFPETRHFLRYLKEHQFTYNIVTTSTRRLLTVVVEKCDLEKFINPLKAITKDDVPGRNKPAPDPYLLAARKQNVSCEDCLAIEDSKTGIRSALAAGCRTIIINRNETDLPTELTSKAKDQVVELTDVIPYLQQ